MPVFTDRVLANSRIELHWEGFSAPLVDLWRSGWEIRSEEDMYSMMRRIAVRKGDYVGYGNIDSHYMQMRDFQYIPIGVPVNMRFARDIILAGTHKPAFSRVSLVATPDNDKEYISFTEYSLLKILKETDSEPEEIIVDPPTVAELLSQIKEMQAPRARELMHKHEGQEKRVEAKIIAFR